MGTSAIASVFVNTYSTAVKASNGYIRNSKCIREYIFDSSQSE